MSKGRNFWIGILFLFSGLWINSVDFKQEGAASFSDVFAMTYGYVSLSDSPSMFITALKWMTPQLLLLLFWGNYQEEQIGRYFLYIRVRTNRMARHLFLINLRLLFVTIAACLAWILMTGLQMYRWKVPLDIDGYFLQQVVLYLLYQYLILLAVNLISGFTKAIYGMSLIIGVELLSFEFLVMIQNGTLAESIGQWLPAFWPLFYYQEDTAMLTAPIFILLAGVILMFFLNERRMKRKEVF